MGGLETLLPTGGIAAAFCAVILYLLRANAVDRKDYRQAIEAWEAQWTESVTRYRTLQGLLDEQRDLRRKAEDEAARATRAVERATSEISDLRDEVNSLRAQLVAVRSQLAEMTGS